MAMLLICVFFFFNVKQYMYIVHGLQYYNISIWTPSPCSQAIHFSSSLGTRLQTPTSGPLVNDPSLFFTALPECAWECMKRGLETTSRASIVSRVWSHCGAMWPLNSAGLLAFPRSTYYVHVHVHIRRSYRCPDLYISVRCLIMLRAPTSTCHFLHLWNPDRDFAVCMENSLTLSNKPKMMEMYDKEPLQVHIHCDRNCHCHMFKRLLVKQHMYHIQGFIVKRGQKLTVKTFGEASLV